MNLIDKDALVAEVDRLIERAKAERVLYPKTILSAKNLLLLEDYDSLKNFINTLEVKDPYEQIVQYDSIKAGIQAHAETYSFNIESELFNQLTEEQQKLWRKEIEQACISGGEAGVELARDIRYKENLEVKEVDLEKEVANWWSEYYGDIKKDYTFERYTGHYMENSTIISLAKHFFELGMQQSKNDSKHERTERR